ncbi:MAG: hypothetical protein IT288_11945 [Bdellovibrionales bacterium]|nr:hypothetical protein [Bdellovibrionales bacterium]
MRRKIRQFFWFMVVGGLLMTAQGLLKPSLVKDTIELGKSKLYGTVAPTGSTNQTEQLLNGPAAQFLTKTVQSGLSLVQKGFDTFCKDCGVDLYRPSAEESDQASRRVRVLVPSENGEGKGMDEVKANGKPLVYQDGKYHEGVTEQIYYDKNGTPTLVIDKSQQRYAMNREEGLAHQENVGGLNPPTAQGAATGGGRDDGALVNKGVDPAGNPYGPTAMKEMIQTVKQAKKNMEDKNRALSELSK